MQVFVGGMPANAEVSTDVWQYRQSMPLPPTCRAWLNCTGWVLISFWVVTHPELSMAFIERSTRPTTSRPPKILSLARVLALR